MTDRLARWLNERANFGNLVNSWRKHVIPDHWALLFGQITVASFVARVLSGVFLLFFYDSSVMIAAILVHILRISFTGAFCKPQNLTWLRD